MNINFFVLDAYIHLNTIWDYTTQLRWRSVVMTNNHETIHLGLSCVIILVGGGGYD